MSNKLTRHDVQEILAILESSNFDDLKIETDDFKISLRRNGAGTTPPPAPDSVASSDIKVSSPASAAPEIRRQTPPSADNSIEVKAPMFGVFFRAPKPGADPYVAVGAKVKADTVIGIIEVMKLMNAVPAGVAGEIVEMIAPDGDTVEYGQLLMRVRPD